MAGKVFKGSVGHQELAAWVEGLGLLGTDKSGFDEVSNYGCVQFY